MPVPVSSASLSAVTSGCPADGVDALARMLFDWDTEAGSREAVVRRIARVADPSGFETPGLLGDLNGYLPDQDAWIVLAGYRTRQSLTTTRSREPETWPGIAAAARARLPVGTAAFTIDAIRRRTGTVGGAQTVWSDRVSFTMIVRCPSARQGWRLLRLSRLGEPLP